MKVCGFKLGWGSFPDNGSPARSRGFAMVTIFERCDGDPSFECQVYF